MSLNAETAKIAFLVVLTSLGIFESDGAEWHVSPAGTNQSDGTVSNPWNLRTALGHPQEVQPGDTIWLHGGTYDGESRESFSSRLLGAEGRPIVVRQALGERAIVCPTLTIDGGGYTWFWGFEVTNPDTRQYEPHDHSRWPTVWITQGRGVKLINLVVHGGGQGIGAWVGAIDLEVYGCIMFHNGWAGSRLGHAIYTQNDHGTKRFADNIIFNQLGAGYGFHCYGSAKAYVNNFRLEGNVCFNNGEANILIGGGGRPSEKIGVVNNYVCGEGVVQIGYKGSNKDAVIRGNYFACPCIVRNWEKLVFESNTICCANPGSVRLDLRLMTTRPAVQWNRNTYLTLQPAANIFAVETQTGGTQYTAAEWRAQTGFDSQSKLLPAAGHLAPVTVFVRPNQYRPGRAHIIVFNWAKKNWATVDVSSALRRGDAYELRDVEDYLGDPIIEARCRGRTISVPMQLTRVMQPSTSQERFEHSPREFGVFVLQKK